MMSTTGEETKCVVIQLSELKARADKRRQKTTPDVDGETKGIVIHLSEVKEKIDAARNVRRNAYYTAWKAHKRAMKEGAMLYDVYVAVNGIDNGFVILGFVDQANYALNEAIVRADEAYERAIAEI